MSLRFNMQPSAVILAQVVTRKDQRASGMLLFAGTIQVRRVADHRLDLFLAVTKVVIRNQRYDHTAFVPTGKLERIAPVIKFTLFAPAHAVPPLPFVCLVP